MLTRKQHELLMFIHERLKESGIPPSYEEMKAALNLKSKSGIHRLIMSLEERGFIRRLPNRARARFIREHADRTDLIMNWDRVLQMRNKRVRTLYDPFAEAYAG